MATPRFPQTPDGARFDEFDLKHCFDATLELLNNWRQHSGLPIMKAWLASDPSDSRSCLLANALSVIALDPNHKQYERTSEHVSVGYDTSGTDEDGRGRINNVSLHFPVQKQAQEFAQWANEYIGETRFTTPDSTNTTYGPAWMAVIAVAFDNKHPDLNEDLFRGEQYVINNDDDFTIPTNITAIEPRTGQGESAAA